MQRKLYEALASAIVARLNCEKSGNAEWFSKWEETAKDLVLNHVPSGGGFDAGTTLDFDKSDDRRLVFHTAFHHMNDVGMYDGWSEHTVTIVPAFIGGFNIRVSGRNRNEIKDYITESFHAALSQSIKE